MSDNPKPIAVFKLRFEMMRGEYVFDQSNDHPDGAAPHTETLRTAIKTEALERLHKIRTDLESRGIETRLVSA